MIIGNFDMRFVIGFLIRKESVLLIKRIKKPWMNKWNGIGGKIKSDETPTDAFLRKTLEEAGIKLTTKQVQYSGIVTWETEIQKQYINGMFAFVSHLSEKKELWSEKQTREGLLAWKPLS